MGEELEEFFLNTKPVRILVKLNQPDTEHYASSLSTHVDATYSHTVKILDRMEQLGLVKFEEKGRKKLVRLTEKGEELAEPLTEFLNKMDKVS